MELVKAKVFLEDVYPRHAGSKMVNPEGRLDLIERAGRVCYQTEPAGNTNEFVKKRITTGHESVIEHSAMTMRFVVDRGVTHELVRHRLCAFSQESTRYVDYTKGKEGKGHCKFIIPSWLENELEEGILDISMTMSHTPVCFTWLGAMANAEGAYQILREKGWIPQQARSVLPNSTKTEIWVTANFREWRHIFKLRCAKAAHPDMRHIMMKAHALAKFAVPVIFDDVVEGG